MISRSSSVSSCALLLLIGSWAFAQTGDSPRYNYDYVCNKERINIGHCRHDSDTPDMPATVPEDDYCQVYYPDRPKTNGFEAMAVVLQGDLVKTLNACGALAPKQPMAAAPPSTEVATLVQSGIGLFNSAKALLDAKDNKAADAEFAKAEVAFTKAIELDSKSYEALVGRGGTRLYAPSGKLEDAIADLKQALTIRQDQAGTWNMLGRAYQWNAQWGDAVRAYERTLALAPDLAAAQFNVGNAYAKVGRYEDALRHLQRLLPMDTALADRLNTTIRTATQLSANWPSPATPVNPKIELVSIPPGTFTMGAQWPSNSMPIHQVSIRNGFLLGKYEVTQDQWQMVMGANPSFFKKCGGTCPVEQVSWNDAQEFIRRINALHDGHVYRLPNEAEWEYAYRAGTTSNYYASGTIGWNAENSGVTTHPVGGLPPNAFGLYDMAGNVAEWTVDVYRKTYDGAPVDGSAWLGTEVENRRVVRNASFYLQVMATAADHRMSELPEKTSWNNGFRVAASK
jgi:formylglycine-generating enzyme required for sulfatase activity